MQHKRLLLLALLLVCSSLSQAQQYYAVLIVGQAPHQYLLNHQWLTDDSYWTDTILMYEMLLNQGYSSANITVLYYDGNPYEGDNRYLPSRIHIDGAATVANVENTFTTLQSTLTSNDVLFIWTFDHGSTQDWSNNSSLLLYQDLNTAVEMSDVDFAALVNPIPCQKRIILMGQCFSGGFIDNLTTGGLASKTLMLTAAAGDEDSRTADDLLPDGGDPHEDEFLGVSGESPSFHGEFEYHVLNAIKQSTVHYGGAVASDADGNGATSFNEFASWELDHSSTPEHPQQFPASQGTLGATTFINTKMDLAAQNKSVTSTASWSNSGRHLAVSGGKLHELFISAGEVFYRRQVRATGAWEVTVRLSDGTGDNDHPGLCIATDGSLHAVWEHLVSGVTYNILHAASADGSSWSPGVAFLTDVTAALWNAYPVITAWPSANLMVVVCTSDGPKWITSSNLGSAWEPNPHLLSCPPGYETDFWYPSLTTIGETPWLSYDYRTHGVWLRAFSLGAWSPEIAVSNPTGTNQGRCSSIAQDRASGQPMVAFCAQTFSEYEYRNVIYHYNGTFQTWGRIALGVDDVYPSLTSSYFGSYYGWRPTVASSTSDSRIHLRTYDMTIGNYDEQFLASNAYYAALAEESETNTNLDATVQWTTQGSSPYTVGLWSGRAFQKVDANAALAVEQRRRLVMQQDSLKNSFLSVEVAPIKLLLTTGDTLAAPFVEELPRAQALPQDTDSLLSYVASPLVRIPANAREALVEVDVTDGSWADSSGNTSAAERRLDPTLSVSFVDGKGTLVAALFGTNTTGHTARSLPLNAYLGRLLAVKINPQALSVTGVKVTGVGDVYYPAPARFQSASLAKPDEQDIPTTFGMVEAYPNPFNPSTTLRFGLPRDAHARLIIYDLLGSEVAHLADGFHQAGYHTITWNAQNAASGLYFARLTVTNELRRMVYTKTSKLLLTR